MANESRVKSLDLVKFGAFDLAEQLLTLLGLD